MRLDTNEINVRKDGPTGEEQDINCWACGKPMVSREWIVAGKRLWSTIHPTDACEELARTSCDGAAGRIARWKKDKPAVRARRDPYSDA